MINILIMRILKLNNLWMMKKDGLLYLQIKRNNRNKLIVILIKNKAGLLLLIMLKKWLKLILPTYKLKNLNSLKKYWKAKKCNKNNMLNNSLLH